MAAGEGAAQFQWSLGDIGTGSCRVVARAIGAKGQQFDAAEAELRVLNEEQVFDDLAEMRRSTWQVLVGRSV